MKRLLLGFRMALVLGLSVFALGALAPIDLEAQCAYCRQTGGTTFKCDAGSGEMRCDGVFLGLCSSCGEAYASIPSQVTPDGALYRMTVTEPESMARASEALLEGVLVVRSPCSGAIVGRSYLPEAAQRMRLASATLIFD